VTAQRLAHLERIPFVDANVAADLRVESSVPERLHARAVEKHVPVVKFLRRSNQRKGGVSQLCRAALRVSDEERGPVVIGRDTYVRSHVTIELTQASGCCCSAAGYCCCEPSPRLPCQTCGDEVVGFV